jgi:hypothetical protein
MTVDPEAAAAITTEGVQVQLVTAEGTVLDQVAYSASDCKAKMTWGSLRRINCRAKGQQGRLSFTRVRKTDATFAIAGSFGKRNIDGMVAANETPLGVVMAVGADGSGSAFGGQ